MNKDIKNFIKKYVDEIKNKNAALFIGAGFSKPAGFINWKELLKDMADELNLDVERENDLVSLAQYYCNKKGGNRFYINQTIKNNFSSTENNSKNHEIIARLPIFSYWTTNYDTLIEESLRSNHRIPDVKRKNADLSLTEPNRDSIVYKMHGDISSPNEAIIIKEDYETYDRKFLPFVNTLKGDLISKTFLFLGFSFTDPNINYILSRIKVEYDEGNVRQHYAILKKLEVKEFKNRAEYNYFKNKFSLFIEDLKRYQIEVLLINSYSEITLILEEIEKKLNQNTIFISGSAASYEPYSPEEARKFIKDLSKALIKKNYNIVSGFGLGVGSEVIVGALEELYMNTKQINENRLLLRPFPQGIQDDETRKLLWTKYRKDMISHAGITLFLFGNKLFNEDIVLANGMEEEYQISKENGNVIVPIGLTGYVAKNIYTELSKINPKYFGENKKLFDKLNNGTSLDKELINTILELLKKIVK